MIWNLHFYYPECLVFKDLILFLIWPVIHTWHHSPFRKDSAMKRLIVCCDGTWNTPDQTDDGICTPTNVVKIFNAVDDLSNDNGIGQIKYYHPGVGSDEGLIKKITGGITGKGIDKIIMSAYSWLCRNYQPGDDIFFFGFSRGAFTVRSVSGLINKCSLLDLSECDDNTSWDWIEKVYRYGYRGSDKNKKWKEGVRFISLPEGLKSVPIKFIGVWDTVGSLGIPDDMSIINLIDDKTKYQFHDTELCGNVEYAMHAVAIDEIRASFSPTLWTNFTNGPKRKQVWFPGEHGNVGGGKKETGLSDGALLWMIEQAKAAGLVFKEKMVRQIKPDPLDFAHTFSGVYKMLRTQPRNIPLIDQSNKETIHESAIERQQNPPIYLNSYRKTYMLKPGDEMTCTIYAKDHWNETGIYLEKDAHYKFSAKGQWTDGDIKCGPGGTGDGKFHFGEVALMIGSTLGKLENLLEKNADIFGTKRIENYPWMSLIGIIANCSNPGLDGTPDQHQHFLIGDNCELKSISRPGYLYCFANDSWKFYWNNQGSVTLNISRIA